MSRAAIAVGVKPWSASATSTASKTRVSGGVGRRSATSQKASSPKPTLPIRSAVRSWPSSRISSAVEVPSEVGNSQVVAHARLLLDSQAPDLVAVLVERRRRQPVVGRRLGERDRVADRRHRRVALADLDDRVEPDLLGEGDAAVDGVDRPARHAGGDDVAEPLHRRSGSCSRSTSSGRSSSRLAVRSSLRANRGSSASSGTPSTSTSLRNWPLLPAVMISSPSAHGSGS